MPIGPTGLSGYSFRYDNWGTNPSADLGTAVTPGTTNAEGSWAQVASSANIAQDCYWIYLNLINASGAGTARNILWDIGVDPAGGTSYTAVISNLQCGAPGALTVAPRSEFIFPWFIKSGSSVAVRAQGSYTISTTARAVVSFFGLPTRPEVVPVGAISQTLGTITNSSGQSFTPGNATDGTWADLGATTSDLWWWQLGYGCDNAAQTVELTYLELAWGDSSNKHRIYKTCAMNHSQERIGTVIQTNLITCAAYTPVPSGANIYLRGNCSDAPDTGYHATVIGIGG